jgi:hypothetical protein
MSSESESDSDHEFDDLFPEHVKPTDKIPREKKLSKIEKYYAALTQENKNELLAREIRAPYAKGSENTRELLYYNADVNSYPFADANSGPFANRSNLSFAFQFQKLINEGDSILQLLLEKDAAFKDVEEERESFRKYMCGTPLEEVQLFLDNNYFQHVDENDVVKVMETICDGGRWGNSEYLDFFMKLLKKILKRKGRLNTLPLVLSQVMPGTPRIVNDVEIPTYKTLLHSIVTRFNKESYMQELCILLDEGAYLHVEDDQHRTPLMLLKALVLQEQKQRYKHYFTIQDRKWAKEIKFLSDAEETQSVVHAKDKLDYLKLLAGKKEMSKGPKNSNFDRIDKDLVNQIIKQVLKSLGVEDADRE